MSRFQGGQHVWMVVGSASQDCDSVYDSEHGARVRTAALRVKISRGYGEWDRTDEDLGYVSRWTSGAHWLAIRREEVRS